MKQLFHKYLSIQSGSLKPVFHCLFLIFFLFSIVCCAQSFTDFEVIDFGNKHQVSAIEISPDKKTMALGTAGGPVYFWDIETKKVIREVEVNGYPWGPYMHFSSDGKYLLLIQQHFTNFAINKDRPSRTEVMDVASGKILMSKDGVHSASFGPNNQSLIGLKDDEVIFWNIQSGDQEKKLKPEGVTNAMAYCPKENLIAVSQKSTEEDLKNIPSIRSDKKAIKEALKFREVVVFYDALTLAKKIVVTDIFDIVFSIDFSRDGSTLYLFNAPNTRLRANNGAERNGYIQTVNVSDAASSRIIFPTSAPEPIYKESANRYYFAAASLEPRFRILHSVNLFERESGSMLKNFVLDFRIGEDVYTGRASFEFYPDGQKMLLGYGAKLAIWKIQ